MSLVRLIYVSRIAETCDMEEIEKILKVSRRKNAERDITGMLCYDPTFFMQCLEGPKDAVNELYADIARDGRHTRVTLLEYRDIEDRVFPEWTMAFVRACDLEPRMLRKYNCRGKFDPFALNPEQARDLVIEILKHKQEQLEEQKEYEAGGNCNGG